MPDPALGWSVATLIDQPAELLLAGGTGANGFNPFRVTAPVRRRRAWLKRADGSPRTARLLRRSAVRRRGAHRRHPRHGHRLVPSSTTVPRRVAASLRRGEVLDHILWRMGQEVLAPRMMQAALDALVNALGAEGAAVIDVSGEPTARAGASRRRRRRRGAGRGDRCCSRRRPDRRTPSPRTAGRSWPRSVTPGSAPMPASRCGARPARAAGTATTSC